MDVECFSHCCHLPTVCYPISLMGFESFRDFIAALDHAGELKRISEPTASELEITEIADREMKRPGGGKALLF